MAIVKQNTKTKENTDKGKHKTLTISLALLAMVFIVLIVSTTLSTHRDSSPEQVSSSSYTGQITILDKTESPDDCAFMYTQDDDLAGEKRINRSEPLCEMASIGSVYMEDGYLDYKSLVHALEAQG